MRFRTKTILGVAAIEMALLAVLVGSALSILRESNETELIRRVQLGGKLLAAAAKDAVISQDLATLDSLVDEAMASGQIDFVRILDSGGVVLSKRGEAALLARPFHQETSIDQVTDGIFDWATPVLAGGIRHGEVQIGISTDPLRVLLSSARRWAAGIAGLEMLLVAVFSWMLGSYLTHQLVALRKASHHFVVGDFDHRVLVKGSDELAKTAEAFNRMAQQLGESHDLLRAENGKRLEAQQEAELARARAEDRTEQLNAIFELSPDGFVSFGKDHQIKYVSPAFAHLTGLDAEEMIGLNEASFSQRLADICDATMRFPGIDALRATRGPVTGEGSGRRLLIELAAPVKRVLEVGLRTAKTETISQILYFCDVTHETEVDRMKSEFLTTAAHELRTPMASIFGFTELLLTQAFEEADQRDFLSTIYRQSELMISIINELLDLSRIEGGGGKDFAHDPVEIHALLQEACTVFKTPAGREAPVAAPAGEALWVSGDRNKLSRAVTNVLSNAYKYSPNGGAVQLELTLSRSDGRAPARIGIRVTDHGIGMTPEQLSRVCERFYRADASGNIPGTGLGMSIVKEILMLHGGDVDIDSVIGRGTTVTLWLPSQPANQS